MAWQTPKTDWAIQPRDQHDRYNGDWFNWPDYERIRNNVEWLADASGASIERMWAIDDLVVDYPEYSLFTSGDTITDQMRYAAPVVVNKQINPIERNMDILAGTIFRPSDFPATKIWAGNGPTPTINDLNRWESLILYWYNILSRTTGSLLPYSINGGALSGV